MTTTEINELLDGTALLESLGNLYEFVGVHNKKLCFQAVNDDSYIKATLEDLLTTTRYQVQQKGKNAYA